MWRGEGDKLFSFAELKRRATVVGYHRSTPVPSIAAPDEAGVLFCVPLGALRRWWRLGLEREKTGEKKKKKREGVGRRLEYEMVSGLSYISSNASVAHPRGFMSFCHPFNSASRDHVHV